MTEPTKEMKAMAREIAANAIENSAFGSGDADKEYARIMRLGYFDKDRAVQAALAAIIETQRRDAEVADDMRDKFASPTGDAYSCGLWDQGVRIATAIRSGKQYGKE